MSDWWLENAAQRGRHTLVDLGYVREAGARCRAEKLMPHLGRRNFELAGGRVSGRLLVRIPPRKVRPILARFRQIRPAADTNGYCWCTHVWL